MRNELPKERFNHLIHLEMLRLNENEIQIDNPLLKWNKNELDNPLLATLRFMKNTDYIYFCCKYILNIKLLPYQQVIIQTMWYHAFPMLVGSRGMGKSFLLAVYALLRALWMPGRKIVITGSGFRQAKTIMNYIETIYNNAPVLRSMVMEVQQSGPRHDADRWTVRIGDSIITAIPIGDGSKIRGERANDILADEFASISKDIFETVIAGFGVVELEPYEQVRKAAEVRVLKNMGLWTTAMEDEAREKRVGNQSIISGTAYYQFNHFAEYWRRWHSIITSKGDKKKLALSIGEDAAQDVDWRDYCIIRMPVGLLPDGYMDERHVARSKATVHSGTFANEFGAIFSSDTNGFFKRTLIESCVTNEPIKVGDDNVQFRCVVRGHPNMKYIYGIDPASENDKFSIVILEIHETHRRVVYCWTANKADHTRRIQAGLVIEDDFYAFCVRKIRDLMKVFPCLHIAMDSQGGGMPIREAFHDMDKLESNEQPIWEICSEHEFYVNDTTKKEKPTDRYSGLHILEMCNFANAEYMAESNNGLRKDLEDHVCLFPMTNDLAMLATQFENDQAQNRIFDTYEDCFNDIEELKNELTTIILTATPGSGRDRWDTPEVKLPGSKKGRMRKDRYSALIMANYAARRFVRKPQSIEYNSYGGFVGSIRNDIEEKRPYVNAPAWFANAANNPEHINSLGKVIKHGVN